MPDIVLVIAGLFVGVAGAIVMMWPTIAMTESEIDERSASYVNVNPKELRALRRERRFARFGGIVVLAGAFTQTVGALAL